MEGLGPYIYHERQEPGSMMCGQHALNSLLQGNYFTAPDLAQIGRELDELEQDYNESAERGRSTNMDDTGYFSVQVLENALKNTFGLTLTRWRSAEMRVFQASPDDQLAFVLNLHQHWFTLRRFGRPNGKGFWFNLNSFLPSPEWVGGTYLGMVLQQAEKEGYSVFVVRPVDPNNPEHILPETEADILAETLNESAPGARPAPPSSLTTARTHSGAIGPSTSGAGASGGAGAITEGDAKSPPPTGLEDEDIELQRALQASLMAGYSEGAGVLYDFPDEPGAGSSARPSGFGGGRAAGLGLGYGGDRAGSGSGSGSGPPSRRTPPGEYEFGDPPEPRPARTSSSRQGSLGPTRQTTRTSRQTTPGASRQSTLGASRESTPSANTQTRTATEGSDPVAASAARARLRLEQMQREQAAAMHVMGREGGMGFGAGMAEAVDVDEAGARRRREAQERVRRAREEEEEQVRLALAASLRPHGAGEGEPMGVDPLDEEDMDEFVTPPSTTPRLPATGLPARSSSTAMPGTFSGPPGDRHYDDEDAELQAALKASLEQSGAGLTIPSVPTAPARAPIASASASAPVSQARPQDDEDDEEDEEEESTPAPTSPEVEAKAEVADPEEMRRRRLARFGG
ncbi:Josephin-domain-containing protein [Ceratobasidium sp. AG-I]|nr:Josephin-domain-containing protein [Ceratobasidium sp. AG-I]